MQLYLSQNNPRLNLAPRKATVSYDEKRIQARREQLLAKQVRSILAHYGFKIK